MNAQLHLHTNFSLFDGEINAASMIDWCKKNNCTSFATTDHGTLMAVEEFRKAIAEENAVRTKNGESPINYVPGIEAYVLLDGDEKKRHLVLLPKDYQGYRAMMLAVTASNESTDSKTSNVMTAEILNRYFGSGTDGHGHVYALSACIAGVVSAELLNDVHVEAKALAEETKAAKIDIDWVAHRRLECDLSDITITLDEITAHRRDLSAIKDKSYKKRLSALEKLAGTPAYDAEKALLDAEMKETEQAIIDYPKIKNEESATSQRSTVLKTELRKYTAKMQRYQALLDSAAQLRSEKIGNKAMEANAREKAIFFNELFGNGFFFMELQYHEIPEEAIAYPGVAMIAQELGLPMVVTNDCHIVSDSKEDRLRRQLLRSLRFNKWEEEMVGDEHLYIKTDEELKDILLQILPECIIDEAISEKNRLIASCNVVFPQEEHYPKFPTSGITAKQLLRNLAIAGVEKRYPKRVGWTEEHKQRVRYELDVIDKLGVIDYLLIVQDFLEYGRLLGRIDLDDPRYLADPYNIELLKELGKGRVGMGVGCGRGSAVGSLVCYLIGITDADPIKYGLLFERFLNTERVTMPDIDSDFSPEIRGRVLDYVKNKYGEDAVCCIMTEGTQAAKASIRNCARLISSREYGDGKTLYSLGDDICSEIPNELGITLNDTKKGEGCANALKSKFVENRLALEIISDAMLVEGTFTTTGMHAAGVIIADNGNVRDYLPLMRSKDGQWVSQFDMNYVEGIGLLKMDFLGLRNLSIITNCLRSIQENLGLSIEMDSIPLDDAEVYKKIFCKGNTDCVFQFESDGMKKMLQQFKPETLEDIILLVAAYRPGPMASLQEIIDNKLHDLQPTYIMPAMESVLGVTYGKPIYQEQVMAIFNKFAGFTLGESDVIRRYMSKKKTDKFMAYKDEFIDGLVSNGADREDAETFWESLISFSKYAFNKSHACAYAITAYYTAWLKCHYPREYFAAVLNDTEFKKVGRIIANARQCGVTVLPPDINESDVKFTPVKGADKIRYGLSNIKQVSASAEDIIEDRDVNGPYTSFEEFVSRVSCPKDIMANLVISGSFDSISGVRAQKMSAIRCGMLDAIGAEKPEDETDYLVSEKTVLSAFLSNNPVAEYKALDTVATLDGKKRTYNVVGIVTEFKKRYTKDNKEMASFTLEDETGSITAVIFPTAYAEYKGQISENAIIVATGYCKEDIRDGDAEETVYQLVVNAIRPPELNIRTLTITCENYSAFYPLLKDYKATVGGVPLYVNTDGRSVLLGRVSATIANDSRIKEYLTVT